MPARDKEQLVQAVRAVAAQGDVACERAILVTLPFDVGMWLAGQQDLPYDDILCALSASVQKLALLVVVEPPFWLRWKLRLQVMTWRRKLPR